MSFDDGVHLGPDDDWYIDADSELQAAIDKYNEEHNSAEDQPVEPEVLDELEDEDEEITVDEDDTPLVEVIESEYLAPDNQADSSWEVAHRFMTFEEAQNYCDGSSYGGYKVPIGVLYIVLNEDGSADVYRDPDYGEGAMAA